VENGKKWLSEASDEWKIEKNVFPTPRRAKKMQKTLVLGLSKHTKRASALGIFDMSGNALEWCWDKYSATVSSGMVTNPQSASSSTTSKRVLRGGNWTDNPLNETAVYDCMTGKREDGSPSEDNKVIGFRLAWKE